MERKSTVTTINSFRRWAHITRWRLRYLLLDTPLGRYASLGLAVVLAAISVWQFYTGMRAAAAGEPQQAWVQIVIAIVVALISYALTPKTPDAVDQVTEAPHLKDGMGVRMVFGEVWITDPAVIGWKKMGTKTIRGKKSGFNGRPIIGYWFQQLFYFLICRGPVDAVLEFRGGDKTAWKGEMTATGEVQINQRDLWGGQGTGGEGGIEGPMEFRFGDAEQQPSSYLASNLSPQQPAYRGLLTVLYKGGLWGAFTPYPKAASFKVRRILAGWEREGGAWYPEKAEIATGTIEVLSLGPTSEGWKYRRGVGSDAMSGINYDDSDWEVGASPFASSNVASHPYVAAGGYPAVSGTDWPPGTTIWVRRNFVVGTPFNFSLEIFVDNFATVWINGHLVLPQAGVGTGASADRFKHAIPVPSSILRPGENLIALKAEDVGSWSYAAFKVMSVSGAVRAMNPAHMLYQSITDSWMGAESEADINDASFRTAADRLYAEGFGLCTQWDSTAESVEQFQQRICDVIGASLSRSLVDGLWYLDLIRGDYDTSTLQVLTDDDIIDYSEQPGTMQDAVNQVIVEWRDPQQREDRSTAPVQSLGGIQTVGAVVGEVATYREIPDEQLALRVAGRDLQSKARPLRRMQLKVTRIAYAWRPGQVICLQSAKRGIAKMYCRVGDIDRGTLRSGAISLSLLQDVFGMPETVYVQPEPGSDVGGDGQPKPAAAQVVQEMPYALLAALQSPAELAALGDADAYLFGAARPAGTEVDYSLQIDAGAGYEEQDVSDWCPTAVCAAAYTDPDTYTYTVIAIAAARGMEDVPAGAMVLWGDEICRLDAVNLDAGTVVLGRGCADTVPQPHALGERLWFITDSVALDATRYSAGATINAKLLTRSISQRLDIAAAPAMPLELAGRAARPYPPAAPRINGEVRPAEIFEVAEVSWRHRDRLAQAGELVDQLAASSGPEPGVTYTVRWYLEGELVHTATDVAAAMASYAPTADGVLRVEIEAMRDGLASWQMQVIECSYRRSRYSNYTDQASDTYVDAAGNNYIG